ncbi:nucleotidyltransferase domain-containing protein [Tunturiibacter psychrotolerans]|uniref:nucleotidyltransferase domain-containing protein n=1 Tax=Tunturiibacter psychrotolerans TaxID=3069686 RepID=UPI003D25BAA2
MRADRESCELLLAIARSTDGEQIHRLAAKVGDWDSLVQIADEHRILPMLFLRLADIGAAVPLLVREHVRIEYERNMFNSLANAVELITVLKAFEDKLIPAMPFKGVVLGASIYHDLTTRPAGDLDLLIRYEDRARATTILLERGYEPTTASPTDITPAVYDYYEYHFERATDGMVVELRWRLTQPRFRFNLGMDWVWPRRRTTVLGGAKVPDMSPEINLIVLCTHGSKHAWSRLIWICDVAQLLASSPDLDWKEVTSEVKKAGLGRALALGILLAHRVAGATVPQTILRRFEADTTVRLLAKHIQENLFDAPGSTPPGPIPYSIQLLDFRDRVGLLLSTDLLELSERDLAAFPLPKSLHALYYLIRPLRILCDRSAR